LDYCNAVLAGIPLHLARRLQSVMNAAARLLFASSKCDHITPVLRQLHWLKVPWRIDYKLAVLVYKCLHGLAPSYLADELYHPAESEFRRRRRSASSYSHYPTLGLRRLSFSRRRCTDLEQSSAAYHICSVASCLLLSLEDIGLLLRTLLPVILLSCPRSDNVIYGHVNRFYLLDYLEIAYLL